MIPTPVQRRHCVNLIKNRLICKIINQEQNSAIVEGYNAAIDIIKNGVSQYSKIDVSNLHTPQSRAIAFIAVDFVNGETTERVLMRIPLKKQIK